MSSYQQIAAAFNQVGLDENNLVTESQIYRALDSLAKNHGMSQYDRNVAEELWSETPKQNSNQVYIRDFIQTVMKGQSLVKQSIDDLERSVQYKNNQYERTQALQDIASYSEDLKFLTLPFGGVPPRQSQVLQKSGFTTPVGNQSRHSGNSTVIFARDPTQKQGGSSTDLKVAFLLAVILICVEMVVMFHKHHFYSLLALLAVLAIFFLGYFDLHFMRFVKINLFISIIFDIVWLVFNFGQYWNPVGQTQHSSLQWAYLKFILLFIVALIFFKLVLIAILFKYRNNPSSMRRTVNLCGTKYNLDGSPTSLVARIFNGNSGAEQIPYNPSGNYSYNQNF